MIRKQDARPEIPGTQVPGHPAAVDTDRLALKRHSPVSHRGFPPADWRMEKLRSEVRFRKNLRTGGELHPQVPIRPGAKEHISVRREGEVAGAEPCASQGLRQHRSPPGASATGDRPSLPARAGSTNGLDTISRGGIPGRRDVAVGRCGPDKYSEQPGCRHEVGAVAKPVRVMVPHPRCPRQAPTRPRILHQVLSWRYPNGSRAAMIMSLPRSVTRG